MIDEPRSSDIQGDQMEGEIGVSRSIIDQLDSSDTERDRIEGESGVTRSIIDELRSWDIQGDKQKVEVVLLEVSLMNFMLRIFSNRS